MVRAGVSRLYIQDVSQTACVGLPCLAMVSPQQQMASRVIHIMTPFCAIPTVMNSCCLATFPRDSDNNKQRVTCQRGTSNTSGAVAIHCLPVEAFGQ